MSVNERAAAPDPPGSSEDPKITLPDVPKTPDDAWERSMLQALEAWGSSRSDPGSASPAQPPKQPNNEPDVRSAPAASAQPTVRDAVGNPPEAEGSAAYRTLRLQPSAPEPTGPHTITSRNEPRDRPPYDTGAHARGWAENEPSTTPRPAVFPERRSAARTALDAFGPQHSRQVARREDPNPQSQRRDAPIIFVDIADAKPEPVEPRLTAPAAAGPPELPEVFSRNIPSSDEEPVELPATTACQVSTRKCPPEDVDRAPPQASGCGCAGGTRASPSSW